MMILMFPFSTVVIGAVIWPGLIGIQDSVPDIPQYHYIYETLYRCGKQGLYVPEFHWRNRPPSKVEVASWIQGSMKGAEVVVPERIKDIRLKKLDVNALKKERDFVKCLQDLETVSLQFVTFMPTKP